MKELDEIRARLEAATPGPWEIDRYPHGGGRIWKKRPNDNRSLVADTFGGEGNRELLFNTPTDLARLLAAVEAIEALFVDPEHYDSQGPSNGYLSVDNIRAAITAALTPTTAEGESA